MTSTPSKLVPLMIHLISGKRKKSYTAQDQVNREPVPVRRCSIRSSTCWCTGCCELVHCYCKAATIRPATTAVYFHKLSKENLKYLFVDLLTGRMVLWQKHIVVDTSPIRERKSAVTFQTDLVCKKSLQWPYRNMLLININSIQFIRFQGYSISKTIAGLQTTW